MKMYELAMEILQGKSKGTQQEVESCVSEIEKILKRYPPEEQHQSRCRVTIWGVPVKGGSSEIQIACDTYEHFLDEFPEECQKCAFELRDILLPEMRRLYSGKYGVDLPTK